MRIVIALLAVLAFAAAAGCGSDDEENGGASKPATTFVTTSGADTELDSHDVEAAVAAELEGGSGGVVELGDEPPKLIKCSRAEGPTAWSCRLSSAKDGKSVVCVVTVDPATRRVSKRTCGRVDY